MSDERTERENDPSALISTQRHERARMIRQACRAHDLPALSRLSLEPGGFLTARLRQKAWSLLLGADTSAPLPPTGSESEVSSYRSQIILDTNRSLYGFVSEASLKKRRKQLTEFIHRIFQRHPTLHYYQGVHNIAEVFFLTTGKGPLSSTLLERALLLRLRDFMLKEFTPSINPHLDLPLAIIAAADPELSAHLLPATAHSFIGSIITLFSYSIRSIPTLARLFDFLLAHPAAMVGYVYAACAIRQREQLLEFAEEPEMAGVIISKLPSDGSMAAQIDSVISEAAELYRLHPPSSLLRYRITPLRRLPALASQNLRAAVEQAFLTSRALFLFFLPAPYSSSFLSRVTPRSVLRTTAEGVPSPELVSCEDAVQMYTQHERDLIDMHLKIAEFEKLSTRLQGVWVKKRPLSMKLVGFAILVGFIAWYYATADSQGSVRLS